MTCQQNSNIILKSVNKSVEEKSAVSIKSKIVSMHVLEVSMHYLIITNRAKNEPILHTSCLCQTNGPFHLNVTHKT